MGRASHRGGEVGTPSEDVWEPLEGFKQGRELRVSLDILKGDLDGCVESKQRGISEVESGKPARSNDSDLGERAQHGFSRAFRGICRWTLEMCIWM